MMDDFPPLHGPIKSTSGLENISGSIGTEETTIRQTGLLKQIIAQLISQLLLRNYKKTMRKIKYISMRD